MHTISFKMFLDELGKDPSSLSLFYYLLVEKSTLPKHLSPVRPLFARSQPSLSNRQSPKGSGLLQGFKMYLYIYAQTFGRFQNFENETGFLQYVYIHTYPRQEEFLTKSIVVPTAGEFHPWWWRWCKLLVPLSSALLPTPPLATCQQSLLGLVIDYTNYNSVVLTCKTPLSLSSTLS